MIIEEILKKIDDIATLPQIPAKVLQIISNPHSSATELSKVIEHDPPLSTKILKIVNSPYYGLRHRISNLKQAIAMLGFDMTKSLALSVSVFEIFKGGTKEFDRKELFKHMVGVGILAGEIAKETKCGSPEEAFTGGLLHDIGKIVLDYFYHDKFMEVIHVAKERNLTFIDAENIVLDVNHTMLGKRILDRWNFPSTISDIVLMHHTPPYTFIESNPDKKIVYIINIADVLCKVRKIGFSGDSENIAPMVDPKLADSLELTDEKLEKIIDNFKREFESVNEYFEALK